MHGSRVLLGAVNVCINAIFSVLNGLSVAQSDFVNFAHVVLVDLYLVSECNLTSAKAADFVHQVAAGPCKNFPLFLSFVSVSLIQVFVGSEDRELLQLYYYRLYRAAQQKHHKWFVKCFDGGVDHPMAVLQSQWQHIPSVKEGSPAELSESSIIGASSFRENDDRRKLSFLFN